MAGNTPAISTGAKHFGTISDNKGVVIGDILNHGEVIGLGPAYIDIDFMLNPGQALR